MPERLRLPLLVGGLIALFFTSHYSDANVAWKGPFASIPWAALIGIVLIGAPVGLALLARRRAMLAGLAGAVLAIGDRRRGMGEAGRLLRAPLRPRGGLPLPAR